MLEEKPRRRTHRPSVDPDANYSDFEESAPTLETSLEWPDLLDALYAYVCERAESGDPARWRCLIERFGKPYGRDAHYTISYAIDRLKVNRRVRIDDSRIPERILPTREIRSKNSVGDFRLGG